MQLTITQSQGILPIFDKIVIELLIEHQGPDILKQVGVVGADRADANIGCRFPTTNIQGIQLLSNPHCGPTRVWFYPNQRG